MSNLREPYAATEFANLEWSVDVERAIDKVAAAGVAPELGTALWRVKYCNESASFHRATKLLLALFAERYRSQKDAIAAKCVDQALAEWLSPACQSCNGARELVHEGLRIVCQGCGGSGLRRYSDLERARRMQMSMGHARLLAGKISWLYKELCSFDRKVNFVLRAELEREL